MFGDWPKHAAGGFGRSDAGGGGARQGWILRFADEVIRAALQRFDDERLAENAWLLELAEESLAEPGPDIPADEVFAEIYAMRGADKS